MNVSFFLPLQEHRTRSGNRVQTSHLPLFPGYLFLHGDAEARLKTLETKFVAQCLPVLDQTRIQNDLSRVHRLMTGNAPMSLEDRIQPGTPVQITDGIFAGMTGKLLRRGSRFCFIVEVEILRQGVSIEIDRGMFRVL
jgi:transcriptional antiterminator RfaH